MINTKVLNIKGAVLDRYQLENYLEKVASDHVLQKNSDKSTYPIPRVKENFKFITKTYDILNNHLKMGIHIHPAGEWLLDNYYIIEECVKGIEKELTLDKYTSFLGLQSGPYAGTARIYVLAAEIVAYTDCKIDGDNLKFLIEAYQRKKTLNMEEIWNIGLFLQIAILENIRGVCEKIYSSQVQKYKVESIVERLVEQKQELTFKATPEYQTKNIGFGEMKYPFIEYMSYRLKKYGRKASSYLRILEEQVNKMGTSVSDVIKKEHFDIAVRKVLMGNSIVSIKAVQRINFLEIFEQINGVEDILRSDPAGVYAKMDFRTKDYYRNRIKEISKKTKISELYIASRAYELAESSKIVADSSSAEEIRKTHIGYYLIAEGQEELMKLLLAKYRKMSVNTKLNLYIVATWGISAILSVLIGLYLYFGSKNFWLSIFTAIFAFLPITEVVTKIVNTILAKVVKARLIPKMDFSDGVPESEATFVVIPTIINSAEKVRQLMHRLEVYYLANKSDNIYFAVLGDCTSSKQKAEAFDEGVIATGFAEAQRLSDKYPQEGLPRFHFLYRERTWNNGEGCYLGWERKRGLLNQFNEFLLGNEKNVFRCNTIEEWKQEGTDKVLPVISYVLTLDADTDLVLNAGLELIGAMAHPLNTPILDKDKNIVVNGYGLMQPRVGIDLESGNKSLYTKIFAGLPGTDSYTNAVSDVYQDNFGEGIFTGKGIYNLQVFSQVLKNQIPENTVLSHDLLEGSYLRCALVSDVMLLDGYPFKYNSNMLRLHRWIRGDWQIIAWLGKTVKDASGVRRLNPINRISKFKILDNLRRSLVEVSLILALFSLGLMKLVSSISLWWIVLVLILSVFIPVVIDVILKKEDVARQRAFTPFITGIKASFIAGLLNLAFLPNKAYLSFNAMVKALYRMKISKKSLLEWTTAEEAERSSKTKLVSYFGFMGFNLLAGIITIALTLASGVNNVGSILIYALGVWWILAPIMAWYVSRERLSDEPNLTEQEIRFVKQLGEKTWSYFKDYMTEENHYLPPDNYQESRRDVVVNRTSSTNIGLGLLAVVSAFDLGYISLDDAIDYLEKIIQTVQGLAKWNGHLYNWYNIKTLEPLYPRYISTVDSGNFVGYLYTLKQFLVSVVEKEVEFSKMGQRAEDLIRSIDALIDNTDFSYLYEEEKGIFSIGFNVEDNKLTDCYYDLLASEARQASIVAIAKKDVPAKHWSNLSRTLTSFNGYKGLISWAGTAFEYLMPNINIRRYPGSLLDESSRFLIMCQQEYAKRLGVPWGISEAAFNLKDLNGNYQYKAFGIPWLGLKRGLADELNIAPYASALAIQESPKEVIANFQALEKEGMLGKYGFYEALDYTQDRLAYGQKNVVVQTYMAHHQGLILLSINNLMNDGVLQRRFMKNPEVEAIDILLQERMPNNVLVTKEKKEKVGKLKYKDFEQYTERTYTKLNTCLNNCNVISNDDYKVCTREDGSGFSSYQDILINRYKELDDYDQGILVYLKNIKSGRIWTASPLEHLSKADQFSVHFTPDMTKFSRRDENIKTTMKIVVAPTEAVEIRQIELRNDGTQEEILEVSSLFEPVLSTKTQEYAHPAFNNLFLKYEFLSDTNSLLIKRNKRGNQEAIFLGVNLYTEDETIGDLEYEIDKQKMLGRGNIQIPRMIANSLPFSRSLGEVTDPIVALRRTIKLEPGQKVSLNLILAISRDRQEVERNIRQYQNAENIEKTFALSRARVEEENRYLGIRGVEIEKYQKMLSFIIFQNPMRKLYLKNMRKRDYAQSDLWKYGISGDLPILLLTIKDVNDIYVVQDLLKAYEYFRVKNVKLDFIILNEEENVYEKYVKEAIEREIQNRQLSYMQNISGGIFVFNAVEMEDKDLFLWRANLVLHAEDGDIEGVLHDWEDDYKASIKLIGEQISKPELQMISSKMSINFQADNLKYFNEYGGFSEDGKEYHIRVNKDRRLPTVWSHVLANPHFGTVITENMGGFTWSENSRLNRLSSWSNNPVLDIPSEIVYLKDKDSGKAWSLGLNPMPDENDYVITYGFGYAKYQHNCEGILQDVDVFVPTEDKVKVNIINLKNIEPIKKNLKLVYYIKPVLGEDEINTRSFINLKFKEQENFVYAKNFYTDMFKNAISYVSCSEKISSFTGSKASFIGNGTLANPDALKKVGLDFANSLGQNPCIAIQINICLEPYERKEISLVFGNEDSVEAVKMQVEKYGNLGICKQELSDTRKAWYERINCIQVKTPLESLNIMLNGWAVYQTIACRLWARSGFYQSGGAYGFRDQLQDTLGIKYVSSDFMKSQILKHAAHQFIEGDVEHWWHEETNKGIRTKFSDDLLWLAYLTAEYIEFTGDEQILDIEIPYIVGPLLDENTDENYDTHPVSEVSESLYLHCVRAIEKGINFGEHGIPKIGSGDWNDGFSTVGNKGRGESVWLGFFLYDVLGRFIPLCKRKGDEQRAEKWETIRQELKKSLNSVCWDGRWYKRAFTDDGKWIGSMENEEARIDSIAQSWSIISNAGDNDKRYICMESLENYLVDRENELIKLLTPAFEKSDLEPGYIKAYLPGVRENGGQYTHAAMWVVWATTILGFGDRAMEYYRFINPIEHARTMDAVKKYKVEPYVVVADMYEANNLAGRGGWTWYTGSSSWFNKIGLESILGLHIEKGFLEMRPCIPTDWKEYSLRYRYKSSIYYIKVKNPNSKNTGVAKFWLNGKEVPDKKIHLADDGKSYEIEIEM